MPSLITSDNGVSSGSAGLKTTAASDGALALQTTTAGGTATTAVTIDTSQRVGIKDATIGTNPLTVRAIANTYVAGALALQDAAGTGKSYITPIGGNLYFGDNSSSDCATINQYGVGLGGNAPQSGLGVRFPATQSASSDANTLDDYEEGTWTPGLTSSGTALVASYNNRNGSYTKIGNTVHLWGYIAIASVSSATGSYLRVTGLPFTLASNSGAGTGNAGGLTAGGASAFQGFTGLSSGDIVVMGAMDSGGTEINIWKMNGNGSFGTGLGGSNVAAGTLIYFYASARVV